MISSGDLDFLQDLAGAVVESSRVRQGESIGQFGPNITGKKLIRPGGRNCYPAFWIRDFAMSLESGLISREEQLDALLLTAEHQAIIDWHTPSGSFVPRGAIADHISFDGKPIFFPGTIDDYEGQGGNKWGYLPSLDDHFYFIEMAWHLIIPGNDKRLLELTIKGISLAERLEAAFAVPPTDADGILVCCDEANRGVSFGFSDSITHTGNLLFCSLLRCRAARQLGEIFRVKGDYDKSESYKHIASRISENIPQVFSNADGLLCSSTGKSSQPDVWGSAFAVYSELLLESVSVVVSKALTQALEHGTIAWKGNIRHVPEDADFNAATAWEIASTAKNTYQNGAYWGTATGWVAYAVTQVNEVLAADLIREYIKELREGDFRQGAEFGSPWECIHYDGDYKQNPVYMTSVTCPLIAFRRLYSIRLKILT